MRVLTCVAHASSLTHFSTLAGDTNLDTTPTCQRAKILLGGKRENDKFCKNKNNQNMMPDIGRIAIKDIFLELLYKVQSTPNIDAKSLCNAIPAFSYDFIKGVVWELHRDGMIDLENKNEYNFQVKINDKGKSLKENGGYAKNYRNLEFEIEEARERAIKKIKTVESPKFEHPLLRKKKFNLAQVPVLKPFFRFKKYKIAGLLLKIAVSQHATAILLVDNNLVEHKMYQKQYMPYPISNFIGGNPMLTPERILEAVDILADAKHVLKYDNPDTYKIRIEATPVGERAHNDGFYVEQATKTAWQTFGAVIGGILVLFSAIKWLIPLLLRLL